jgi:hypothetical protein
MANDECQSKQIEAETTFSALRDLSTLDDHDDVDRAPDERAWGSISGTLLLTWWLISAAEGPKSYRAFEAYINFAARRVRSVLFHMGAHSSSAGPAVAFRLGY